MSKEKKVTFSTILKNLFFLLLIIQFIPVILGNFRNTIADVINPKTNVAFLQLKGMIVDSGYIVKQIHKYLKRDDIKALLIKVDSGGGTPGSAQAIFNELKKFKEKKPIVALVEDVCASGAYNCVVCANSIIAQPSSMIGSVGVILSVQGLGAIPNFKELFDDWKISFEHIYAGKYKTAGSLLKKMSAEEIKHMQVMVQDSYKQFISDVAAHRNLSLKKEKEWADGKIFTGNQALKLNLIDKLGSMTDALEEIKKIAEIETEINLVSPVRPSGLMAMLSGDRGYATQQSMNFAAMLGQQVSAVWTSFIHAQSQQRKNLSF